MRPEVITRLKQLDTTLTTIEKVMDPEALAARIRELEAQAGDPLLWDDPEHAQKVTSELSSAQAKVRKLESLRGRLDDMPVMYELAEEEGTVSVADEDLAELESAIESLEVTTMLSGEYDPREAVINIRSGAGGGGPDVFVHGEEENPGHGPFRGHDVPSELHTERDHRKWGNPPRQGPT